MISAGWSIRTRLLLGSFLWLSVGLCGSWFALSGLLRAELLDGMDAELLPHLEQLVAHLEVAPDGRLVGVRTLSDPRFVRPYSGLYWQVVGPETRRSRSLWDAELALPADDLPDGAIHRHLVAGPGDQTLVVRERTVRTPAGTELRVAVGGDRRRLDEAVARFGRVLALSLLLVGTGILAAAVAQVAVGLRPLDRLRAALGTLHRGPERRIAGVWPKEIQPLVDDLNATLAFDAAVLQRARTQAGILAHSLKTPLTILFNRVRGVESTLRDDLLPELEAIRCQVDRHLSRSRAAVAATIPGFATVVRPQLDALVRTVTRAYPDRDLIFTLAVAPDLTVPCEVEDFNEMAGNLLDNAAKWAAQEIRVEAADRDHVFTLTVADDGPGLSTGTAPAAGPTGSGVGLSIVADLAGLYGGGLALLNRPEGGLSATVTLPEPVSRSTPFATASPAVGRESPAPADG